MNIISLPKMIPDEECKALLKWIDGLEIQQVQELKAWFDGRSASSANAVDPRCPPECPTCQAARDAAPTNAADDLKAAARKYANILEPLSANNQISIAEFDAFKAGAKWQATAPTARLDEALHLADSYKRGQESVKADYAVLKKERDVLKQTLNQYKDEKLAYREALERIVELAKVKYSGITSAEIARKAIDQYDTSGEKK